MTRKKKPSQDAANDVEGALGGLFGALNGAIGEMMSRLEEGTSGTVARNQTFHTEKGPVRAQAGIRLRMGGMDIGPPGSDPQPMNPDRPNVSPASVPEQSPELRDLSYEVMTDNDAWVLTADLPGVVRKDIDLSRDGTVLKITTTGTRLYSASVDFERDFSIDDIKSSLRNGILTLRLPLGGTA